MPKHLSYIRIDRRALLNNIRQFKNILPRGVSLSAVVKANAYGHGLREIVQILDGAVTCFQVDDIDELRVIREVTNKPVFVFGFVKDDDLSEVIRLGGVLGVYNRETIVTLNKKAKAHGAALNIHLKIDAFLGRQGLFIEDLKEIIELLKRSKFLRLESVYSHFSNIEDTNNLLHAKKQYEYLMLAKEIFKSSGFEDITHHISATSGILTDLNTNWGGVLLRLGIGMYGLWPSESLQKKYKKTLNLKPVLSWITHVAQIKALPKGFPVGYGCTYITERKMKVAVIPQGYSDGYDRGLSNNSFVLIRGCKCRVLGRIAMNMFVVDISKVRGVKVLDKVTLIGKDQNKIISADILASNTNTINYEVVARISPILPRVVE